MRCNLYCTFIYFTTTIDLLREVLHMIVVLFLSIFAKWTAASFKGIPVYVHIFVQKCVHTYIRIYVHLRKRICLDKSIDISVNIHTHRYIDVPLLVRIYISLLM